MRIKQVVSAGCGRWLRLTQVGALVLLSGSVTVRASENAAAEAHKIPAVDAGVGPCSVQFTVTDDKSAPVYDAKVKVHIAYGFIRAHRLDLEVSTNVDGKARFEGLPNKTKFPWQFEASQGTLQGSATYDPAENCKAEHSIVLIKAQTGAGSPQ